MTLDTHIDFLHGIYCVTMGGSFLGISVLVGFKNLLESISTGLSNHILPLFFFNIHSFIVSAYATAHCGGQRAACGVGSPLPP